MKTLFFLFFLSSLVFDVYSQEVTLVDRVQGTPTTEPDFIHPAFDGRQWIVGNRRVQVISPNNIAWEPVAFYVPNIEVAASGSKIENLAVSADVVWFTLEGKLYSTVFDNETLIFGDSTSVTLENLETSSILNDSSILDFEVLYEENIVVFAVSESMQTSARIYIYEWKEGNIQSLNSFSTPCDFLLNVYVSESALIVACNSSTLRYQHSNGQVSNPQVLQDESVLFMDQINNQLLYRSNIGNDLYLLDLRTEQKSLVLQDVPFPLTVSPYGDFIFNSFEQQTGTSSSLFRLDEFGNYHQTTISGPTIGDAIGRFHYRDIFLSKEQVLYYGIHFYELSNETLEYELKREGFFTDIINNFSGSIIPLPNDSILFSESDVSTIWTMQLDGSYAQQLAFTLLNEEKNLIPIRAAEGFDKSWWVLSSIVSQQNKENAFLKHINAEGSEVQVSIEIDQQISSVLGETKIKYFESTDALAFILAFDSQVVLCSDPQKLETHNCIVNPLQHDIHEFFYVKNGFIIAGSRFDDASKENVVAHYQITGSGISLVWEYLLDKSAPIGYYEGADYVSIPLSEESTNFFLSVITIDLDDGNLQRTTSYIDAPANTCQWKSKTLGLCSSSYTTVDPNNRDALTLATLVDKELAWGDIVYIDSNDNYVFIDPAKQNLSVMSIEFPELTIKNFERIISIENRSFYDLDLNEVFSHPSLSSVEFLLNYSLLVDANRFLTNLGNNVYRIEFLKDHADNNFVGLLELNINDNGWSGPTRIFFDIISVNTAPINNLAGAEVFNVGTKQIGESFEVDLTSIFSDPEDDQLTFSLTREQQGFSIENNIFKGVNVPSGVFRIDVIASDPEGLNATAKIIGNVNFPNQSENPSSSGESGGGSLLMLILIMLISLPFRFTRRRVVYTNIIN